MFTPPLVEIGAVTYPTPGVAQVMINLDIMNPRTPLLTAVEMFTALEGVRRAEYSLEQLSVGQITLWLVNPHTSELSDELLDQLKKVCVNIHRLEHGIPIQV